MANYRRRRWRESMTVRLDVNALMATGVAEDGLDGDDLELLDRELGRVGDELAARRGEGGLAFADLPAEEEAVRPVLKAAAAVREAFDTVVVLGIGGSALGARALLDALDDGVGTRVVVADAIDPAAFGKLLDGLDLTRTLFNVISKSGETAETMAQFLVVRARLLRELGAVDYKRHLLVTTDPGGGAMRQIVNDEGFQDLHIPAGVGGRFSVLTPVGLFPAAAAGIDVEELLAGAAWMDERSRSAASPMADPALVLGGALWRLATGCGKSIVVLMAYSERLASLADWFAQLWAESLGKAQARDGRTVEWGQTPVAARGAADQHSQLQLWVEGPRDKVVLFLRVEEHGAALDIPATYQDIEAAAYLGGHALGELLNAEQRATELALARRGRPSATLVIPEVNAFTVGQLVHLFECATVVAGALAGVDPFGQPGVEEGKRLAYGLMGRPGFESRREEVEAWLARKDARFVI